MKSVRNLSPCLPTTANTLVSVQSVEHYTFFPSKLPNATSMIPIVSIPPYLVMCNNLDKNTALSLDCLFLFSRTVHSLSSWCHCKNEFSQALEGVYIIT